MPFHTMRRAGWLRLACALAFTATVSLSAAGPSALAQDAPGPGMAAFVANSGGNSVLLRDAASPDGGILTAFPEGTPLTVLDGPLWDAGGSAWYEVAADGASGYMLATYLGTATDPGSAAPADAAPAEPTASGEQPIATMFATTDLNLRAGPTAEDAVLAVVPAGDAVTTTGEASGAYLGATWGGQSGWLDGGFLAWEAPAADPATPDATAAAPADPAATGSALAGDPTAVPSGTAAFATDLVNLRAAADASASVLRVLPPGSPVTVTGADSNGFTPVWYNGTDGYIASDFLSADGAPVATVSDPAPTETTALFASERSGEATVLEDAVVRVDPSPTASVVTTLATGTALAPTGDPVSGFYPVEVDGTQGWVSGALLAFQGDGRRDDGARDEKKNTDDSGDSADGSGFAAPADPETGPGLIWPVSGGTWSILQGYYGSSHQNQTDLWQYQYSFDLVREDGPTAGAPVVSPLAGEIRWFDPSTGGISIDVGNGHAIAMFHLTVDPGLQVGDSLDQGEYVGYISDVGGPGFREVPHVHLALWGTSDGGNWDRHAEPFVGAYAIEGHEFPDIGGTYQYTDYTFTP